MEHLAQAHSPSPRFEQHLENLRRKDVLRRLRTDRATCLLPRLFRLGLRRFCYEFYLSKHPVRFACCMNTIHGRRISGPEKEHSMSEETTAIGGIAALA